MATHNDTGSWGEDQAVAYLQAKGYAILKRNYRYQQAEIDIIAKKDRLLVFLEVKTRRWTAFGLPETFVNSSKVRLIKKAAEHYIFTVDWMFDIRFDIVAILIRPSATPEIVHIEDAFY